MIEGDSDDGNGALSSCALPKLAHLIDLFIYLCGSPSLQREFEELLRQLWNPMNRYLVSEKGSFLE